MNILWPILFVASAALMAWEFSGGLKTGSVEFKGLRGDRQASPFIYWFVMSNLVFWFGILVFVFVLWIRDPAAF